MDTAVYVIIYYDESSEQAALVGLYYNEKVAESMYKKELKKLRDFVKSIDFSNDVYLQLASLPVKRIDADGLAEVVDEPANHDFYRYINKEDIYLELVGIKIDRINDKDLWGD